jgi:hypothetical protein
MQERSRRDKKSERPKTLPVLNNVTIIYLSILPEEIEVWKFVRRSEICFPRDKHAAYLPRR